MCARACGLRRPVPEDISPSERCRMREPAARLTMYGVAGAVFAIDRLTKWMIETRLSAMDTHVVIPGFFEIVHSENRGAAFGLFADSTSEWRTVLLIGFSVVALIALIVMLCRSSRLDRNTAV